jgi:hypothetical protein
MTNDSRAAFETHVLKELGDVAVRDADRYISPKIQNYWLTWQASRKSVIEEAAVALEQADISQLKTTPDLLKTAVAFYLSTASFLRSLK